MGLVVIVTNSKGGPGKSTTSVNLALVARSRGYRTAVVDADTQQHAVKWVQTVAPEIEAIDISHLDNAVGEARNLVLATAEENEVVFLDTPGHNTKPSLVQQLTYCSDLALVVLEPSALHAAEIKHSYQFIEVARQTVGKPQAFLVFNKTSDNDADARELEEEAIAGGYSVAHSRITSLKPIERAALRKDLTQMRGQASKAAVRLYENLFDELLAPRLAKLESFNDSEQQIAEPVQKMVANE